MPEVTLLCPVRGCGEPLAGAPRPARAGGGGEPLAAAARALACPRGPRFDRARSGYVTLLQPQDRRSRQPGDSREASLARRRLYAAGHLDPLLDALRSTIEEI